MLCTLTCRVIVVTRENFQQFKVAGLFLVVKVVLVRKKGASGFAASEPVQDSIGQYSLKKQGNFRQGLVRVIGAQLDHAVLNNVQSSFFITYMVIGPFKSLFFRAFQKIRQFCIRGQLDDSFAVSYGDGAARCANASSRAGKIMASRRLIPRGCVRVLVNGDIIPGCN